MQTELERIESALRDLDGSCRDIIFIGATWDGLHRLVQVAVADFDSITVGCTSRDMNDSSVTDSGVALDTVQRLGGCAQIVLNEGHRFVKHLQIFVSANADERSPYVELTFFPQDILSTAGLAKSFLTWADDLRMALGATGYYARYENASWSFGDASWDAGVFLVRESR